MFLVIGVITINELALAGMPHLGILHPAQFTSQTQCFL